MVPSVVSGLILLVLRPEYSGRTRSISWLLMPWLLMSPGHQPSWYWPCKIGRTLASMRSDFNHLWCVSVKKSYKLQTYFCVTPKYCSTQSVNVPHCWQDHRTRYTRTWSSKACLAISSILPVYLRWHVGHLKVMSSHEITVILAHLSWIVLPL